MSENLVNVFTTQFSANLEMKLQQKTSKLRGKVAEGFHVGKQASPTQELTPIQLKAPAGRFAPKNPQNSDFTRRWVFPQDGEADQYLDSFDELRTIVDPKSKYVDNAAFASSTVGVDAGSLTTESFDTTNHSIANSFGASATTGLTVAKLIEARRIFRKYHVDLDTDEATLVIGSKQESDLLNQVEVVSTEFNDKPVLVDGKITRFLGFNIVFSERLTVSSNDRYCIAFVKSGMYLGIWKDIQNRASIRNDLSGQPWDLWTAATFGATRLQAGKTLRILCNDTTGADITP